MDVNPRIREKRRDLALGELRRTIKRVAVPKRGPRRAPRLAEDVAMNLERPITDRITIADQPTVEDLARLKKDGYVAVVNLRNDGEPEQPMDAATEGKAVADLGMAYHHYVVDQPPLTDPGVTATCDFIDREATKGKVLVHCRKGGRAAALVLLDQARSQGWKPDDAIARGRALGLELSPGLQTKVEQYLKSQT